MTVRSAADSKWNQRFKISAICGALAMLCAVMAGGVVVFNPEVAGAMQDKASQLRDFLARSPGERRDIDLVKGKGKSRSDAVAAPQLAEDAQASDEVASNVIQPAPADDLLANPPVEESSIALALPEIPEAKELLYTPAPILAQARGGPVVIGTVGGGLIGGGGGGGGSGGTPPPPPVPPVPEPSTWLMMLFGMFAVGAALRRNRRATLSSVTA